MAQIFYDQYGRPYDATAPVARPPASTGELRSYTPTMRENAQYKLMGLLTDTFGMDTSRARGLSERLLGSENQLAPNAGIGLADFTPAGILFGAEEGGRDLGKGSYNIGEGNYLGGSVDAGMGLLGIAGAMLPGGRVAKKGIGKVADAVKATKTGKTAAKTGAGYDLAKIANQYPDIAPPSLAADKKTGKEFLQKELSPEAKAVEKSRKAAQKEIDAGNYKPFFNVDERYYADPANYPLPGTTLTDAMPKKQATIDKYTEELITPEAKARLQAGYDKGNMDPMTKDWYAMGQLEEQYVKELGPEAGRAAFRKDFAEGMAATTGGNDPTSNLLMAHYANYMRQAGQELPANTYNLPYPIGGRYAAGNISMYDKVINQGKGLSAYDNPKRHNFAGNFMGHRNISTIDEQMSGGFKPGMAVPPGDSYGILEGTIADLARQNGVQPANFQDVAWAGLKGTNGKPMMQQVNEMIERTSRVTGQTPQEVLKGFITKTKPMYSVAPVGLLGADYAFTGEDR